MTACHSALIGSHQQPISVIPGRAEREPGIHTPQHSSHQHRGYGFRVRAFGPPRNDVERLTHELYYSSLTFADLMTSCQVSTSCLKKAAVSASEPVETSADRLPSSFTTPGSRNASLMSVCSLSTIACGVFGGATSANQVTTTKPGTVSLMTGTPGNAASGLSVARPSARMVPPWTSLPAAPTLSNAMSMVPAIRSCTSGAEPR